jgi:cell division protein ZapA
MPELTIHIGGRAFEVSCQDGEQSYLQSAAKMLDDEAQVLSDQIGRMPEARMLLMAGLLLADKTAAVEDRIKVVEADLAAREAELADLRAAPAPEPERIEVPIVPPQVIDTLAELAARAEAMAAQVEEKAAE